MADRQSAEGRPGAGPGEGHFFWPPQKMCIRDRIPKFQTATTADLGPSLAGLGLTGAFDVSRADFTGITGEGLSLSGVIQSTVFSVNENGVGPFSENGEAGFAGLYSCLLYTSRCV